MKIFVAFVSLLFSTGACFAGSISERSTALEQAAKQYVAVARDGAALVRENFSHGLATELDVMKAEAAALIAELKALQRLDSAGISSENFSETEARLLAGIRENFAKRQALLESLRASGARGSGECAAALQEVRRERAEFEFETARQAVLSENSLGGERGDGKIVRAEAARTDELLLLLVGLRKEHWTAQRELYCAGKTTRSELQAAETELLKAQLAQVRNRQQFGGNAESAVELRGQAQEILTKIRKLYAERIAQKERAVQGFPNLAEDLRQLKIESLTFELDEARCGSGGGRGCECRSANRE